MTETEWRVYLRRVAVRYTDQSLKKDQCEVCGQPGTPDNPLQLAHRIGFGNGIRYLGLTPDYLNRQQNLVTTHRQRCNDQAELALDDALKLLKEWGIVTLPSFLPIQLRKHWGEV